MTSTLKGRQDITDQQKNKIMRTNAINLYGWGS
jgi:predicted TIM-barrel fold metal-dependent hydrolase